VSIVTQTLVDLARRQLKPTSGSSTSDARSGFEARRASEQASAPEASRLDAAERKVEEALALVP
jgi:hypothetical protein